MSKRLGGIGYCEDKILLHIQSRSPIGSNIESTTVVSYREQIHRYTVNQVTRLRTDGVHYRESSGTGLVRYVYYPVVAEQDSLPTAKIEIIPWHRTVEMSGIIMGLNAMWNISGIFGIFLPSFFVETPPYILVPSPSETWFRGMSVGGSFRRV